MCLPIRIAMPSSAFSKHANTGKCQHYLGRGPCHRCAASKSSGGGAFHACEFQKRRGFAPCYAQRRGRAATNCGFPSPTAVPVTTLFSWPLPNGSLRLIIRGPADAGSLCHSSCFRADYGDRCSYNRSRRPIRLHVRMAEGPNAASATRTIPWN